MVGNRAIYHDGWLAATTPPEPPWDLGFGKYPDVVNGYTWELYKLADDYSEANDLAAKMPDRLRDMKELFMVEAAKYNVFPLDNSFTARAATPRPSATAGRTVFTYSGESSGLPYSSAPDIAGKSYSITAEVEIPQGGAEGMINTLGGSARWRGGDPARSTAPLRLALAKAGACSSRPGGDAQRRWARANHPRGDVSGPAVVYERPHRRASLCVLPQSGNGWIARCHLRRQRGAVPRGRRLRPVRCAS